MTAIDSTHDVILESEGGRGLGANGRHTGASTDKAAEDDTATQRFARLPRDVGWMMVSVGVLGVILPGLPGAPFLIAGIAVLAPGGPRLLARWARHRPRGVVHDGVKQIGRWLDDMERRYPQPPSTSL
jgi:hypothetical protein